jgi:hypothetical protein
MKERSARGGIAAVGLAVVVGLGVAGVLVSRAFDTEPSETVQAEPEVRPPADIAAVYDPVTAGDALPDGFRQLLARDQIEPVYDPMFTTADQVDWPLEMLVLGVAGENSSKAYPVTHLNQHEMVIDHLDGSPILVSW